MSETTQIRTTEEKYTRILASIKIAVELMTITNEIEIHFQTPDTVAVWMDLNNHMTKLVELLYAEKKQYEKQLSNRVYDSDCYLKRYHD